VKRRATQNKSPLPNLLSQQIPPFSSDSVQSLKVRLIISEDFASDVKNFAVELPQVPYGLSVNATTLYLPFKAVRLSKVEMWCNYRSEKGMTGNTINLIQIERRTVKPIEFSDTATFLTPAHICKKFDPLEPLGLWYQTTSGETNPELRFQMPKGAILELTYAFIVSDESSPGSSSGSGLSYPKVYTNCLNSDLVCVGKSYSAVLSA